MASAQITCTKCGAASAEPRLQCARCGGPNARVCGSCGTRNSVAKNFCDHCGVPLDDLGPISPPPRTAVPGSPSPADIPATVIMRPPKPGAAGPRPPAGKTPGASPSFPDLPPDLWSGTPPIAVEAPPLPRESPRSRMILAALWLAAAAAAAYGAWSWYQDRTPEFVVPRLAAEYLDALRARDYPAAYALFTDLARRNCTEDEFRAWRDAMPGAWSWSDLRVERSEPSAILLSYDLAPAEGTARRDYILFIRDGERWARPYNWTVVDKVERAFESGNIESGLLLAQTAATINTRDPMAWGYLCEAAYYHKASPAAFKEADMACSMALELSRTYPSDLTPKSLYHLHAILADMDNRALGRPEAAVEQYGQMLAFPGISPADQCAVLLARASAYAALKKAPEAAADLDRGAPLCADPKDQDFIRKTRASLAVR